VLKDVEILDREDELGPPAKISVVYAASLLDLRSRVWAVGLYLSGAGLVVLLVVAWLTVWSVRRSLSPLSDLTVQAGAITARHWIFRAPDSAVATRELAPLATALETVVTRLHDSFASQRRFTSDLAHELKTHVAIIKSSLQLLQRQPRSAEDYREGVADLLGDCDRLESLVERMLRLARVEQTSEDGARERLVAIEVLPTCQAAMARVESVAHTKNVTVELQGDSHANVVADADDLELVWLNLLENAVRHSKSGSQVVLSVRELPKNLEIIVQDAGDGIAARDLPHVFDRFRRGTGSVDSSSHGFGLGLAICKAIVEGYGGSIELTSTVGQGTTVQILLPRCVEGVPAASGERHEPVQSFAFGREPAESAH